jgi:hypothetical protein
LSRQPIRFEDALREVDEVGFSELEAALASAPALRRCAWGSWLAHHRSVWTRRQAAVGRCWACAESRRKGELCICGFDYDATGTEELLVLLVQLGICPPRHYAAKLFETETHTIEAMLALTTVELVSAVGMPEAFAARVVRLAATGYPSLPAATAAAADVVGAAEQAVAQWAALRRAQLDRYEVGRTEVGRTECGSAALAGGEGGDGGSIALAGESSSGLSANLPLPAIDVLFPTPAVVKAVQWLVAAAPAAVDRLGAIRQLAARHSAFAQTVVGVTVR